MDLEKNLLITPSQFSGPIESKKQSTPIYVEVDNQRYKLEEEIGEGGLGVVFKGQDLKTGKYVAIKLQSNLTNHEDQSLRILVQKKMKHNINIIGYRKNHNFKNGCKNVIIMELADGQFYPFDDRQPINKKLDYFYQISEGISELHELGIIHRDVNPMNIVFKRNSETEFIFKLCDTGLMRFAKGIKSLGVGTTSYMAPEQISNPKYTEKVDIWALGMVFYETLRGRALFTGRRYKDVYDDIQWANQEDLEDEIDQIECDQDIKQLLKQVIVKDQNKRISAKDLVKELKNMFIQRFSKIYQQILCNKQNVLMKLTCQLVTPQDLKEEMEYIFQKKKLVVQEIQKYEFRNISIFEKPKLDFLKKKLIYYNQRLKLFRQQIILCDEKLWKSKYMSQYEKQRLQVSQKIQKEFSFFNKDELLKLQNASLMDKPPDYLFENLKIKESMYNLAKNELSKFQEEWKEWEKSHQLSSFYLQYHRLAYYGEEYYDSYFYFWRLYQGWNQDKLNQLKDLETQLIEGKDISLIE